MKHLMEKTQCFHLIFFELLLILFFARAFVLLFYIDHGSFSLSLNRVESAYGPIYTCTVNVDTYIYKAVFGHMSNLHMQKIFMCNLQALLILHNSTSPTVFRLPKKW